MKAKVLATGEVIDVTPCFISGEIVSYKCMQEGELQRIYLPEHLDIDEAVIDHERTFNTVFSAEQRFVDWDAIYIQASISALSACIIAGKENPATAAVAYVDNLIKELRR